MKKILFTILCLTTLLSCQVEDYQDPNIQDESIGKDVTKQEVIPSKFNKASKVDVLPVSIIPPLLVKIIPKISGPVKANNYDYYTWSVSVENSTPPYTNGTPPYTYEWTRVSSSGNVYSWGNGTNSYTVQMPYDQDLELHIKITDSQGYIGNSEHFTMNTGVIKPSR